MKQSTKTKKAGTKKTAPKPDPVPHITGLSVEENERQRVERAKEAKAKTAITRAVKAYDASACFPLTDAAAYLTDLEAGIIKAVGLLGIALHDDGGLCDEDIEEAIVLLAEGRGALSAARYNLERSGALAKSEKAGAA